MDRLLESYRHYLKLLARTWMNRSLRAKIDPSDLVQETLFKAHQHFAEFRGSTEAELAAWLRQVLSRSLVDWVRRFRAAGRSLAREQSLDVLLDQSAQVLGNLVGKGVSPSAAASQRDLGVVLADALAALSDELQDAVLVNGFDGDGHDCSFEVESTVTQTRRFAKAERRNRRWIRMDADKCPRVRSAKQGRVARLRLFPARPCFALRTRGHVKGCRPTKRPARFIR